MGDPQMLLERAYAARMREAWVEAEMLLDEAEVLLRRLRPDPLLLDVLSTRAAVREAQRRPDDALADHTAAIEAAERAWPVRVPRLTGMRARTRYVAGDMAGALADLDIAIPACDSRAMYKDADVFRCTRARARLALADPEAALADLRHADAAFDRRGDVEEGRWTRGEIADLERLVEQVTALRPETESETDEGIAAQSTAAWYLAARHLAQEGLVGDAEIALDLVVGDTAAPPGLLRGALIRRAQIRLMGDDPAGSVDDIDAALAIATAEEDRSDEDPPPVLLALRALGRARSGETAAGERDADAAVAALATGSIEPDLACRALTIVAEAETVSRRFTRGRELAERAVVAAPTAEMWASARTQLLVARAWLEDVTGLDGDIDSLLVALGGDPTDTADVLRARALLRLVEGDLDGADAALAEAADRRPANDRGGAREDEAVRERVADARAAALAVGDEGGGEVATVGEELPADADGVTDDDG